jgi:hypothetical protein
MLAASLSAFDPVIAESGPWAPNLLAGEEIRAVHDCGLSRGRLLLTLVRSVGPLILGRQWSFLQPEHAHRATSRLPSGSTPSTCRAFGPTYDHYRARVPMRIPFWPKRRSATGQLQPDRP